MYACLLGSTLVNVIIAAACSALDSFTSVSSLWRYVWVAQVSRVTFSALRLSSPVCLLQIASLKSVDGTWTVQAGRVTLLALGLACTSLLELFLWRRVGGIWVVQGGRGHRNR
jgi:hypothetical protein